MARSMGDGHVGGRLGRVTPAASWARVTIELGAHALSAHGLNGNAIAYRAARFDGGHSAIAFINPGYGGDPDFYRPLATFLAERGVCAYVGVRAGFGGQKRLPSHLAASFESFGTYDSAVVRSIVEAHGGVGPILWIGHSMGAACNVAAQTVAPDLIGPNIDIGGIGHERYLTKPYAYALGIPSMLPPFWRLSEISAFWESVTQAWMSAVAWDPAGFERAVEEVASMSSDFVDESLRFLTGADHIRARTFKRHDPEAAKQALIAALRGNSELEARLGELRSETDAPYFLLRSSDDRLVSPVSIRARAQYLGVPEHHVFELRGQHMMGAHLTKPLRDALEPLIAESLEWLRLNAEPPLFSVTQRTQHVSEGITSALAL